MRSTIKTCMALIPLLLLTVSPEIKADSYYSSIGLGLPRYFVSQKAAGMGGAGIGVLDRLAINTMNPAASDIQGMAVLGVNVEYEYSENKNTIAHAYTGNGNATGMQFLIPVKSYITLMTMLKPLTTSQFTVSTDKKIDDAGYIRTVKGSGGMNAASLGLQYVHRKKLAVALLAELNFGSYNETWKNDFIPVDFRDTTEKLNSFLWGVGMDAGMVWRINQRISLGAIYRSASTLHLENRMTLGNGSTAEPDSLGRKLHYPAALGAGLAFELKKWLLAVDYYSQFWHQYKMDGVRRDDLKAFWRISSGIEYQSSRDAFDKYHRRIAYRLGFYYAQLPFTNPMGDAVHETFFTVGIGFPFTATVGRVDMAVEVGQRGDVRHFLYQDRIIRVTGSIIGGERWFQRRY